MKIDIITGSEEFLSAIQKDMANAKKHVFIQVLNFEGDKIGKQLERQLMECSAPDKRVIVDSIVKFMMSDKLIHNPLNLFKSSIRNEIKDTKELYARLQKDGVKIKIGKPLGRFLSEILARNHTKYVLIDNIVYIGGRNFCDHNFDWHDLMLRFESRELADFIKNDFQLSWEDNKQNLSLDIENNQFLIINGKNNESKFDEIRELIKSAKHRIIVHSPYISHPFYDTLKEVSKRGVIVDVISPVNNNHGILNRYHKWECKRTGVNLYHYQGMSHLKAMLIDDHTLIVGTSNFDYMSYRHLQEIIVIIKDSSFIKKFKEQILLEDMKSAILYTKRPHRITGRVCKFLFREFVNTFSFWNRTVTALSTATN
ncbi:MAG: phospholipase D-like domain-containing protein [Candidatus Hodarchaeales archaeon]|jgi:cardiolipin synthase